LAAAAAAAILQLPTAASDIGFSSLDLLTTTAATVGVCQQFVSCLNIEYKSILDRAAV
jgi:hypothetical protein